MPLIKLNATQGLTGTLPAVSGANLTGVSAGKILQVVHTNSSQHTNTNSTSFIATSLTANITPASNSNKVYIAVTSDMDCQASSVQVFATIYRDSTNIAGGTENFTNNYGASSRIITPASMSMLDTPNSSSQLTYTVYVRSSTSGTTIKFNNQDLLGTITLMEIEG
jgi:hypothetical protein